MKFSLHVAPPSHTFRESGGGASFSLLVQSVLKLSFCVFAIGLFSSTEASAATVTNRVTGAANWNTAANWIQNRTGTVTFLNGSKNVTGVSTLFLSELSVGDVLMLQATPGTVRGTVASITSNTQLTLVANASANASGAYGRQQVPGASDDVVIGNTNLTSPAVTITLDVASATVNSLTFTATGVANSLTHSGTNALTVTNALTLNQPTAAVAVAWNINAGTAIVSGLITFAGANATATRVGKIVITTGTLNANAGITFVGSAAATKVIDMSGGAGALNLKGALTVPGLSSTLTAGTLGSIFNYADTAAQTVNFFTAGAYHNLHLNNTSAGGAALSNAITASNVTGNLRVLSGTFSNGGFAIAGNAAKTLEVANGAIFKVAGTTSAFPTGFGTFTLGVTSTVDYSGTGAQTLVAQNYGNLTSSSTGARTLASSGTIGVAGTFTPGTNAYTITGSTIDFNGSGAQTIPTFNYNNLTSSSAGARTLANSGTIGVAGTFTPGTNAYTITGSTIDFNGASAQTVPAFNYNNLTSSSTGARTLANSGTIGVGGIFTPGTNTYTIAGSTLDFNGSGAQNIPAFSYNNLTSSSTGARTLANSGTIGVAGTFTPGTNAYTITGSTIDFNGASAQTVPAFNYNNLTISGSRTANDVTLANSGTIGIAGSLSDTATFNAGRGFVTTGSTVAYNGTGSQSVTALSPLVAGNSIYDNLTISNTTSAVNASTSFSVAGNFTTNANATFAPGSAVVISGAGTLTGSGTVRVTRSTGATDFVAQYTITNKTLTSLTVEFAGATVQGSGANTFGSLKINNSSGVTLSGSITVNGILMLASGNIITTSSTVMIGSTGTVSRTTGHVVGTLQKNIATGASSRTFEVGDASNYTPVDISFSSVTTAGDLAVSTTSGDHPNIAASTFNAAKTVNRYWTLTNSGTLFTNYTATFTFVSADLDAGANTNALVAGRFASATWTYPTTGTRTPNSTQATGLTAFGDFQLGEAGTPSVVLVKDVTPSGIQEPGTDLTYTVTFTNSGSTAAHSLVITDPNPNNVDPAQKVFVNVDYKLSSASISSPWTATIEFSNDGGATWTYVPVSGAGGAPSGYDRTVTNIRWSLAGNLAISDSGTLSFIVRIR